MADILKELLGLGLRALILLVLVMFGIPVLQGLAAQIGAPGIIADIGTGATALALFVTLYVALFLHDIIVPHLAKAVKMPMMFMKKSK